MRERLTQQWVLEGQCAVLISAAFASSRQLVQVQTQQLWDVHAGLPRIGKVSFLLRAKLIFGHLRAQHVSRGESNWDAWRMTAG